MSYCTWKSYPYPADVRNIFSVLRRERHCFFLDSSLTDAGSCGRYSFLGIDPFRVIPAHSVADLDEVGRLIDQYRIKPATRLIPFWGGAVGYLSYEAGAWYEPHLRIRRENEQGIPQAWFGLYNTVVVLDHQQHCLHIVTHGAPETNKSPAVALCKKNMQRMEKLLARAETARRDSRMPSRDEGPIRLEANFSRERYMQAVERAKEYIGAGDIYQVNLSQRFSGRTSCDAYSLYCQLREVSPSAFGGYLDAGSFQLISSSPERFLKLSGRKISTRPMKGTRPRGRSPKEDARLARELSSSAKDRAELTMIVDLERNDLGRVCDYGSVSVPVLRELEQYETVYQTTATIEGRLRRNAGVFDLLRACFPGGSITGCPKLRAMEIIDELEPDSRGLYTGCLGYVSFCGNMDTSILIRTLIKQRERISFGVGGGIVADSDPAAEYEETLVKARGLMKALAHDSIS